MTPILYHFTSQHAFFKIKARGLKLGAMPWNYDANQTPRMVTHLSADPDRKGPGFQWLTRNPTFEQPFCFAGNLPFPRNAYRITVAIPHIAVGRLYSWPDLSRRCNPDSAAALNTPAMDWENWFVYYGRIPPNWFVEVIRNPNQQIMADQHGPQ